MTDLNARILFLASAWEKIKERQEELDDERAEYVGMITALVKKHGATPPRATRLRVLRAEDGTELRVTTAQELRVDGSIALRLRTLLRNFERGRWFKKIFRRVESFVLAEGAHEFVNGLGANSNPARRLLAELRRLFLAAIEERDKSPDIDVRRPEKKESAA